MLSSRLIICCTASAAIGAAGALLLVRSYLPSWFQLRQALFDARERIREQKSRPSRRKLRLVLVRHGESAMNVQPGLIGGRSNSAPLTEKGEEQARKLGRFWRSTGFTFDDVYSSTARRAFHTGSLALKELLGSEFPLQQREELLELSQGGFEGRPRSEVYNARTMRSIIQQGMFFRPNGISADGDAGESQFDVEARVRAFVESLLVIDGAQDPSKPTTVVLFMHGLAIRSFLRGILGSSFKSAIHMDCSNTSMTELMYRPGESDLDGWKVLRVNDCSHLATLQARQSLFSDNIREARRYQ